jgi:tight adherence protein B
VVEFLLSAAILLGACAVAYGVRAAWVRTHSTARLARRREDIEEELREIAEEEFATGSVLGRRRWPIWAGGLGAFAIGLFVFELTPSVAFAMGALGGVFGWRLEERRIEQLILKLETQLADAIDLIVGSVRSGGTIVDAMGHAYDRVDGVVGEELRDVVDRLRLGQSPREVLNDFRERIPLDSFRLFTFTVGTNWEGGGGHGHALSSVGRAVRDRVALRRRLRTQTVETELSVVGVLALTYGLGYLVAHSSTIDFGQFTRSSIGQFVVTSILLLQAVGVLWVQRLAQIRV